MAAYVLPSLVLQPDIQLPDVIAATSLVMLAASIPISFAGWGLREISAIVAMGSIGFLPQNAFLVAILVGLASHVALVCIALCGVVLSNAMVAHSKRVSIVTAAPTIAPKIDYDQALGWAVPICAAMAVFFQLHVPLSADVININLADPIAVVGAGLFLAKRFRPEERPTWSFDHLEICALSGTIVLGLAVVHGIIFIGPTEWAIMNKFIGWFLLLSYACCGALIVSYGGQRGLVTLLLTFAAAGAAVALFDILSSGIGHSAERLSGFAQNPNAFGLQMLLVAVCVLALANLTRASHPMLSIVFAATWLTGSRAVFLAWPFTIGAAWLMGIVSLTLLLESIVIAVIVCIAVGVAWSGFSPVMVVGALTRVIGASAQSDTEHLTTIVDGLRLFAESPIFGAGIGVYVQQHLAQALEFPVIHSTPVWLLAETGVVGFLVFVATFAGLFITGWRRRGSGDLSAQIIVPVLVAFAGTSLAHELLYQRAFWFLLGTTAAANTYRASVEVLGRQTEARQAISTPAQPHDADADRHVGRLVADATKQIDPCRQHQPQ
jgi:hypothetical protein